jgi:hypothetical protein
MRQTAQVAGKVICLYGGRRYCEAAAVFDGLDAMLPHRSEMIA